ncbi:MAG: hypothetical protein GXP43_01505 [bacterium]|nr:hypothetical protein [bacterium]
MNVIRRINQIPLSKFALFTLAAGLAIFLPLSLWLVRQQTQLPSSAAPRLTPVKKIESFGPVPSQPPQIKLITPFIGKVGDVVVIKGKNLGDNPKDREIVFAGVIAKEEDILSWKDDQIQVKVPWGARSGLIRVVIGPWQMSWGIPFIVYSKETKLKVSYQGRRLDLRGEAGAVDTVFIWPKVAEKISTTAAGMKEVILTKPPVAVALYDKLGRLVDFYVDPIEFSFGL